MKANAVRKRPSLFQALGSADPPEPVQVAGRDFHLDNVLKHDSWAATAIYRDTADERIICKFNRTKSVFGIPMAWLGRVLAAREARFLRRLADIDLVPDDLGPVTTDGAELAHAVARTYVDGEVFINPDQTDARFFAELRQLLNAVHGCNMAYVDLHKRENIIVGRDGRPNLIDFQVSAGLSSGWPGNGWVARKIIDKLQEMDDYHYRKHYARCLPETLSEEELRRYLKPPGWIRAHRKIAAPLRSLRRRLLVLLKIRDGSGQAHSELNPEDAFRPRAADPQIPPQSPP